MTDLKRKVHALEKLFSDEFPELEAVCQNREPANHENEFDLIYFEFRERDRDSVVSKLCLTRGFIQGNSIDEIKSKLEKWDYGKFLRSARSKPLIVAHDWL